MATLEEVRLQRELRHSQVWNKIWVLALVTMSLLAIALWRGDRPACPVALYPDGTWELTQIEGRVTDGCKVLVVER